MELRRAALFSDRWLSDAVTERLRDNVRIVGARSEQFFPPGQFTRLRLLQPQDLAVLVLIGFAISEDGSGVLGGYDPDRGVHELDDVVGSLKRLALAGLLTGANLGDGRFRVEWGERALAIAKKAGVRLPEDEKAKAPTA